MSRFIIACGGTGGHLAPGIAVAQELQSRGHACTLLVSRKGVDGRLSAKYGDLDFVCSPGQALSLHPVRMASFLISQLQALVFGFRLLTERPQAVLAFGGFTSVGLVVAAWLRGVPVALHEANRRPGRAIRLLRRFASRVYLPDAMSLQGLTPSLVRHMGYPVRKEISRMPRDEARRQLGIEPGGKLLVVLGGSQGASALNSWVDENAEALCRNGVNIYCITGQGKGTERVIETRDTNGGVSKAWFVPFCDNMGAVLSAANIAVSRAGAGAIAEAVECLVPTILVPYPYAADNHQEANARFLEQQGGCVVVDQKSIVTLLSEVLDLMFSDWLLDRMDYNLQQIRRSDSAAEVASDLEALQRRRRYAPRITETSNTILA